MMMVKKKKRCLWRGVWRRTCDLDPFGDGVEGGLV